MIWAWSWPLTSLRYGMNFSSHGAWAVESDGAVRVMPSSLSLLPPSTITLCDQFDPASGLAEPTLQTWTVEEGWGAGKTVVA